MKQETSQFRIRDLGLERESPVSRCGCRPRSLPIVFFRFRPVTNPASVFFRVFRVFRGHISSRARLRDWELRKGFR